MSQGKDDTITSGDLAKITPEDWLLQLCQAALEVDGDRIIQVITHILSAYTDIANDITKLVRRFRFDEILELAAPKTKW
jgi:two-component system sensor histidine kinase/response regulator